MRVTDEAHVVRTAGGLITDDAIRESQRTTHQSPRAFVFVAAGKPNEVLL